MALKPEKRGCYTIKTYNSRLYTWCPDKTINKAVTGRVVKKKYCTAIPYSQGEDWICTYVYQNVIIADTLKRLAYVECDYVK